MPGRFFVFSVNFVIMPISYGKNYFQILDGYILVKRPLEKLHLHPQWGPNTHDDPHETGAARTPAQALFVQKNDFRKYQKFVNF